MASDRLRYRTRSPHIIFLIGPQLAMHANSNNRASAVAVDAVMYSIEIKHNKLSNDVGKTGGIPCNLRFLSQLGFLTASSPNR